MDASRDFVSWVPVQSSNVESVCWWQDRRTGTPVFGIRFITSDKTYEFWGCREDVYRGILDAPSKGIFFNRNVRHNKRYTLKIVAGKAGR